MTSDPDESEALSKAKSQLTKQSAEILSLRNQVIFFAFLQHSKKHEVVKMGHDEAVVSMPIQVHQKIKTEQI